MKIGRSVFVLVGLLSIGTAFAEDGLPQGTMRQRVQRAYDRVWSGQALSLTKTVPDSVYLIGGRARTDGKFQDDYFNAFPDPEGWDGVDYTQRTEPIWHIDTFNAALLDPGVTGNHAMWCGEYFVPCINEPENPGYGNNYNEYLDWYAIVPNSGSATEVNVTARLNYDNEPGYDFLYLEVQRSTGMEHVQTYNGNNRVAGQFVPVNVDETFMVNPADYTGSNHDQVHLRWHFQSDSAWSDQDCSYPTDGGAQVDNITVKFDNVPWTIDDFEPGGWVNWTVAYPPGVGDFSWVWPGLEDIDDCHLNTTPQWAFVDDGVVVPGTGGYPCITWCYGPRGYVVNPEGGLAGPDFYLHNEVWSPNLAWPGTDYDGALLSFDVYRHDALVSASSPGMFYVWHVQSTDDPSGIADWSGWRDRNFAYYGGPDYFRQREVVTDLLVPGRKFVQIALGVEELGWIWGYTGTDASPAPYFDNVSLVAYQFPGPAISTEEILLAQDNFPEIGAIDTQDPAANHVRFDMAINIALPAEQRNVPGDSIVFDIAAVRTGAVLQGRPQLHYKLHPNPLFDSGRTSGVPNEGLVEGDSVRTPGGAVVPDRWSFDLPDTGFFFPGDIIHYFVTAMDNQGGDIGISRLPGDTTGFSFFPGDAQYVPLVYPTTFTVHALPTLHSFGEGDQPHILFYNDFGSRGGENEWFFSLSQLGFVQGQDYDIYHTQGPSSGVGNGIGGRANATLLSGYETMLYTCGDLAALTISNGDWQNDSGNDVAVMDGWLHQTHKQLFITGDDVVFDLQQSGAATLSFLNTWLSVGLVQQDIRPLIDGQSAPLVKTIPGNPVFYSIDHWRADGGCPILNLFNAVEPIGGAISLAEFTDPDGTPGVYSYSAGVLNFDLANVVTTIYMPYDFMYIIDPQSGGKAPPGVSPRTQVLEDILLYFGYLGGEPVIGVPEVREFSIRNYPNPFNPSTKFEYDMPRAGHLTLKIYDVRGQLVRTLVDGIVPAGTGSVMWNGTNDQNGAVASGIYFYESQALGRTDIRKITLVK